MDIYIRIGCTYSQQKRQFQGDIPMNRSQSSMTSIEHSLIYGNFIIIRWIRIAIWYYGRLIIWSGIFILSMMI